MGYYAQLSSWLKLNGIEIDDFPIADNNVMPFLS